jgi:hypothetical protein
MHGAYPRNRLVCQLRSDYLTGPVIPIKDDGAWNLRVQQQASGADAGGFPATYWCVKKAA